jgi:hypothetical protein
MPSALQDPANDSEMVDRSLSTNPWTAALYSHLLKTFGTLEGTYVDHWLSVHGVQDTNVEWVAKYYRPALEDWVPDRYRQHVEAVIDRNGGFMSLEHETALAKL